MAVQAPSSAAIREHNLSAVLEALRVRRPASRAELSARTGLSKPTVGAALRAFEQAGLVREFGRTTGRRGPTASLYDLVADAVLVLALDIGPHSVRWSLVDLDGVVAEDGVVGLPRAHRTVVLDALAEIGKRTSGRAARIDQTVAGSPGIVDPATSRIGAAPTIEGWEGIAAETVLADALGLRVRVENDVNLAALGEQAAGAGRGVDSFAYLNVGAGLGAGIVLHGTLHRGARGAAGEVGFLPVGDDPFTAARGGHEGAMEARLSTHGLVATAERLARTNATQLEAPFDVRTLFEAARSGDELGRAVVAHAAREIAVCVAGLTAVVDLELVLLGGGIGTSADLILDDIRRAVAALIPTPPHITRAALGERAVLTGATAVALEAARRSVVRRLVT